MYNSEFVRKKKRRKVVAVITGISGITVAVLVIVSFLGKYVGTFTVKLESGSIKLALQEYTGVGSEEGGEEIPFDEDSAELSTYLRVNALYPFHETTYSHLMDLGDDALDTEKTPWNYGANYDKIDENKITSLNFLKYTFYVRNLGTQSANYTVNLKITDSKAGTDGRKLEDTMRVMLYENYEFSKTHNKRIFAKTSATKHYDDEGKASFQEAISYDKDYAEKRHVPFYGYAEEFESEESIVSYNVENFMGGEVMRYTIVYWLEVYDPQSTTELTPPQNALVKLGVEIDAYEEVEDDK